MHQKWTGQSAAGQPVPPGVAFKSLAHSEVGALIRIKDWSTTSLGPMEAWPRKLRGYMEMILTFPTPAIIFWGDDNVQIYNDGYATIMGSQRHPKYLGETYRSCWPETYATIHPWMARVLRTGEAVEVERALFPVNRHGFYEYSWYTFTFSPLEDDAGRIAGILQIVTEVTETVLAENRLATLRALESAATKRGDVVHAIAKALADNPQSIPFCLIYLYDEQKHVLQLAEGTDSGSPLVKQLDLRAASEAAQAVYRSGETAYVEGVVHGRPTRCGIVLPLKSSNVEAPCGCIILGVSPVLRFGATYRAFMESVADASAIALEAEKSALVRKQAEAELQAKQAEQVRLRESERKTRRDLQVALQSGQMATWHVDLKDFTATISPEVARIFGIPYVEHENVSHVIDRVIHPDDREGAKRALEGAICDQAFYSHEYRVLWPNGETRWILAQGDKVVDDNDHVTAYTGVILDITERKRNECRLKEALRARDEFLSVASHELKTPLTSLKLQAQMATRAIAKGDPRFLAPERLAKFVQHTDRQTDRLTRLVDDMLDISRIRAGRLTIQREPMSLSALTSEVVDRLKPVMAAAETPVTYLCDDRVEGVWDQLRLEQIVTNLLTNAMRYGAKKPVTVQLRSCAKTARLEVRDHGLGISPDALERIFNRFERGIDANEVSGLGLGLYITQQIVRAHGGRIWAESPGLGQGSTFIVELPVGEAGA